MKWMSKLIFIAVMGFVMTAPASAREERGSTAQAQALVKKGIAYIKKNGREKAFADFNDTSNKEFHDRDLYLFVYDMNGMSLSHGANPKMIGKNLLDLKVEGKPIIRDMIAALKTKNDGWIDYQWPNPVTKALETKSSYFEKVDDYFVGCGAYK
ncbi:cache domain-containing protein [Undibacterium sp. CY18W]|uniref:Cache domain-containing protein n=1 Tax=Undibacterium hunanense TaxID=2762292 RepID=A0ABR6ZUS5_9BURK|nr:cache domain-containing protein [Undibacterium hunanense]MBC3919622.1 cache domain-containing protein [Undibacterium hunanense]